LGATPRVP
jgi:hypothetical protein